jgi:hypothetical protein
MVQGNAEDAEIAENRLLERLCLPMPDEDAMVAAQGQGNVRPGNEYKITRTFGCWRSSPAGVFAEPGGFPETCRWLNAAKPPVFLERCQGRRGGAKE